MFMKIKPLINRKFKSVSIIENTYEVIEWISATPYFAVVDEELQVAGIITLTDVYHAPMSQLIDLDFSKPRVSPDQSVADVLDLMLESRYEYLPVFDRGQFVGVISSWDITAHLLQMIRILKKYK